MASSGTALGGLLVPAVAMFMSAFGWRAAALGSGVLMLVVGPFVVQVMRHRPSELGLEVDGIPPVDETVVVSEGPEGSQVTGMGSTSPTRTSRPSRHYAPRPSGRSRSVMGWR
jgi:hypothetical protein